MPVIIDNIGWMSFNIFLALVAVFAGIAAYKTRKIWLKGILLFIWLLFIPNTIYILTDVIHIPRQFVLLSDFQRILMFLQFGILLAAGIFTFILSMYSFEKELRKRRFKPETIKYIIFSLNFLIAVGLTMGRIQRTNSWEIVTDISKVFLDLKIVLTSLELLLFVMFFGIISNVVYFALTPRFQKNILKTLR